MGERVPEIPSWPPPRASAMMVLSLVTAGGAAIAGFLGYCLWAAILALLSLLFNLGDFFSRKKSRPKSASVYQ